MIQTHSFCPLIPSLLSVLDLILIYLVTHLCWPSLIHVILLPSQALVIQVAHTYSQVHQIGIQLLSPSLPLHLVIQWNMSVPFSVTAPSDLLQTLLEMILLMEHLSPLGGSEAQESTKQ
jgi:hypothetical protein